jgi:hypothetical protein
MLPVHRREMAQLLCSHLHPFTLQLLNGSCQFQGIPQDDGRHDQVEPLGALLLLDMRTVLHSPLPVEKDGSCQGITCPSLIQANLYIDRVERYQKERNLAADDFRFSERDLVAHFKGESREMKRYILDAVRDGITHHPENSLIPYVDFGGRGQEKPLSYSTIDKTFHSFFIYQGLLETSLEYRMEEGENPREFEKEQILRLMNIIAEEIYVGKFDPTIGTHRIENRVQKGEQIPEDHLRAYRLSREEVIYNWLRYIQQIVQNYFIMLGTPINSEKLFQYKFPEPLWDRVRIFVRNLKLLPVWVNTELSLSAFGGKQNYDYWQTIFETGKSPQNQQVLATPLNLMEMIRE